MAIKDYILDKIHELIPVTDSNLLDQQDTLAEIIAVPHDGYISVDTGYVAFGNAAADGLTGESNLFWDASNNRLGINDATPSYSLDVNGTLRTTGTATFSGAINAPQMQQYLCVRRTSESNSIAGAYNPLGTTNGGAVSTMTSNGITFNSATGVATIAYAGVYEFAACLYLEQSSYLLLDTFRVKNGSTTIWSADCFVHSSVDPTERTIHFLDDFAASDTVEIEVSSNGVQTLKAHNGCTLLVKRIA